jgi:site-specific recombinase XerD
VRVLTVVAQRTQDRTIRGKKYDFVEGEHYPSERFGLRNAWDQVRAEAGLTGASNFKWHNLRSDFACKLLRSVSSGQGMKMVQQALDHEKIGTTLDIYAGVTDQEYHDAVETLAKERAAREMQWSAQEPLRKTTAADSMDGTND